MSNAKIIHIWAGDSKWVLRATPPLPLDKCSKFERFRLEIMISKLGEHGQEKLFSGAGLAGDTGFQTR